MKIGNSVFSAGGEFSKIYGGCIKGLRITPNEK